MKKNYPLLPYSNNIDTTTKECWDELLQDKFLDKSRIDSIEDDDTSGRMMTAAIPNPLARILLFKNAFNYFDQSISNKKYKFDGPYSYIVSDCLDLIQFMYEKPAELFIIKEWNIVENINKLINSQNLRHQKLGKTLLGFLDNEFKDLDFDTIHLIYYKPDIDAKEILIGGTSPYTIFYTSPNWNRYLKDNDVKIFSNTNDDIFFDEDPLALESRAELYKKYLYYISSENTSAELRLPNNAISSYIKKVKNTFDSDLSIEDVANTLEDYEFKESASNSIKIKVSNFTLKRQKNSTNIQSDLFINAELDTYKNNHNIGGNLPIVIGEKMEFNGVYFNNIPYTKDLEVNSSAAINLRKIPTKDRASGTIYPYLNSNDFFTDNLIKIPYQINDEQFYTGSIENSLFSNKYQYLLPLTKTYFNFFSPSSLHAIDEENNNKRLTVSYEADYIVFILNIPVSNKSKTKKSYVKLSKKYKLEDAVESNVGFSMFPRLRYGVYEGRNFIKKYNFYNILSFYEGDNEIELNFFEINSVDKIKNDLIHDSTRLTNKDFGTSIHYQIKCSFDFIELIIKGTNNSGIIAPIFIDKADAPNSYNASIDFGTSNTFVAFSDGDTSNPSALTFDKNEANELVAYLNKKDKEGNTFLFGEISQGMKAVLQKEFIPPHIGSSKDKNQVSFPIRTVSVRSSTNVLDENKNLFLFSNLAFHYDTDDTIKDNDKNHYEYITNIKQKVELDSSGVNKIDTINILVELLWLIKCKVLLNGGSLKNDRLKIIWTYPSTGVFKKTLIDYFNIAKQIVFGIDSDVSLSKNLSESIAPFIYLSKNKNMTIDGKAINIDIGGGTTDIVIKDSNKEGSDDEYVISSVKFAGNDLWGNGINDSKKTNGYIRAWEKKNLEKLNKLNTNNIEYIYYDSLCKRQNVNASDKLNILFKYNEKFEFTSIFSDFSNNYDYLKLPLLLHLSSIMYYTLSLFVQKSTNSNSLFGITFSGKGSTYLNILFSNNDDIKLFVSNYIKAYNTIKGTSIQLTDKRNIVLAENPKEVTAYGALYDNGDFKETTLYPATNIFNFRPDIKIGKGILGINQINNSISNDEIRESLINEYKLFFTILLETDEMIEVYPKISPNLIELLQNFSLIDNDIFKNSLINSLQFYKDKDKEDSKFFYPLKNALYEISELLFEKNFNTK